MNRKLIIPVKKTENGMRCLKLIMSKEDYDVAVACDLDWLHRAAVSNTDENANVNLVWDNRLQTYKLRLILKELIEETLDGINGCKKEGDRCRSKKPKQ
jgi:hypothetical protein